MKITLVVPAHNEEATIVQTVQELQKVMNQLSEHQFSLVVANNDSTDHTAKVVDEFKLQNQVEHFLINQKGKGLAIRRAWSNYPADIYVFSDADLAVHPLALPPMLAAIQNGADLVYASRCHADSIVVRSKLRKFISNCYGLILKLFFKTKINDSTCGFKVVTHRVVTKIMPQVLDSSWFFDSELMLRAERVGFKIVEQPVDWREHRLLARQSKVRLLKVSADYLKKILTLWWEFNF